jgi:hypothetical protein
MERRLEDRIRYLCHQAIVVHDDELLFPILEELREALRDHAGRLHLLVHQRLTVGLPIEERRRQ